MRLATIHNAYFNCNAGTFNVTGKGKRYLINMSRFLIYQSFSQFLFIQ